jgi:histidinol phosphatase-like PHP family hydrolase
MTAEEIINRFIDHLDYHMASMANVHQSHYKGDFFKLFREAYNGHHFDDTAHPRLTGHALRDILQGTRFSESLTQLPRWKSASTPEGQKLMEEVLAMWDEWQYAWDHHP